MAAKANREKEIFEKFCKLHGKLSRGDFQYTDPPDFLDAGASVAFELVEYHGDAQHAQGGGSALRKAESQRSRVMSLALKEYEAKGGKGQNLVVAFNEDTLKTADASAEHRIAGELAQLALDTQGACTEIDYASLPQDLQPCVYEVLSYRKLQDGALQWGQVQAGDLEARAGTLQGIIAAKEAKIAEYRKHAKSVSLLIHGSQRGGVGGTLEEGKFSTCGGATDDIKEHIFESSFDRVYLLDLDSEKLVELKVQPPK